MFGKRFFSGNYDNFFRLIEKWLLQIGVRSFFVRKKLFFWVSKRNFSLVIYIFFRVIKRNFSFGKKLVSSFEKLVILNFVSLTQIFKISFKNSCIPYLFYLSLSIFLTVFWILLYKVFSLQLSSTLNCRNCKDCKNWTHTVVF